MIELGRGSFGSVLHAIKNGNNYAIKKVENTCPTAKSEMEVLKKVNHSYIIKYYGHFWDEQKICIVLEYADRGTMENTVRAGVLAVATHMPHLECSRLPVRNEAQASPAPGPEAGQHPWGDKVKSVRKWI